MIINESDIYDNLESFRNKHLWSHDSMAIALGLKGRKSYMDMLKNKTLKFRYLLNLINNHGASITDIIPAPASTYKLPEKIDVINDASPPCLKRIIELERDKENLLRLNGLLEEEIKRLKEGGPPYLEKFEGGVAEPGKTG